MQVAAMNNNAVRLHADRSAVFNPRTCIADRKRQAAAERYKYGSGRSTCGNKCCESKSHARTNIIAALCVSVSSGNMISSGNLLHSVVVLRASVYRLFC